MKTKTIKFVIPAMAILFAIAASAFTALDTQSADEFRLINGYIATVDPEQPCENVQDVDCQLTGGQDCTYGSFPSIQPVYETTMCVKQLSRTNH